MTHVVSTVLIGGQAGDGAKEAGINLGKLLATAGQEVFVSVDYPSVIKGGHIFSRISFSKEKIFSDYKKIDLLIALNNESISFHQKELKKDGVIFDESCLPMTQITKEINAPAITRTSVALGATCYYFNLEIENLEKIFKEAFGEKAEINIKLAKKGYQYLKTKNFKQKPRRLKGSGLRPKASEKKKILIDGNQALALGLIKAGLNVYFAYPMTPATSILHFLAKKEKELGLKVVQPENEIAVINMAIGAAYTGQKVAVGTSGGGFDLMQEAMSLAGMAEIPLVIAVSQRPGPSTGVPTYTSQSDLRSTRFSGHGEFPRILLAPGDPEEAYLLGAQALNLAWEYQAPVIVLLDKHLSESLMTSFFDSSKIKIENGKIAHNPKDYKRFETTSDGISPMAFPGMKNVVVKATSYEHDEQGITTEDSQIIKEMQEKRFKKLQLLLKEQKSKETVKVYGDKKSKNIIVSWGSTKGAVLEAMKYLKKSVKFIQPLYLEPLDAEKIKNHFKGAKKIIDIEGNLTGQLASLIREKTGIEIENKILKYDSRPFEPIELAKKINELLS